jgi:hypothetical protein
MCGWVLLAVIRDAHGQENRQADDQRNGLAA